MKSIIRISLCLMLIGAVKAGIAQNSPASSSQKSTQVKAKKQTSKKSTKGIDNKIAVSDQARPSDKKKAKTSSKDNGISNK